MSQIDGFFWLLCGLGLLLVTTVATALVWSAARMAGRDDERLEQTRRQRTNGGSNHDQK